MSQVESSSSWSMTSKQQSPTTLCNVPKNQNEKLGSTSHVALLSKPLHHKISPWSLVRITSTHKPIQHLGPTLTFSLQSPKSHI
jgi:hypothetical protein